MTHAIGSLAQDAAVEAFLGHRTLLDAFGADAPPAVELRHWELLEALPEEARDMIAESDEELRLAERDRREREWPAAELRARDADALVGLCLDVRRRAARLAALRAPACVIESDRALLKVRQRRLAVLRRIRPAGEDGPSGRRLARLAATAAADAVERLRPRPDLRDADDRRFRRGEARLRRVRDADAAAALAPVAAFLDALDPDRRLRRHGLAGVVRAGAEGWEALDAVRRQQGRVEDDEAALEPSPAAAEDALLDAVGEPVRHVVAAFGPDLRRAYRAALAALGPRPFAPRRRRRSREALLALARVCAGMGWTAPAAAVVDLCLEAEGDPRGADAHAAVEAALA